MYVSNVDALTNHVGVEIIHNNNITLLLYKTETSNMTDNELPGNELPNNELRCKELEETSGDNKKKNECSASADNVPKVLLAQQKSKFLVVYRNFGHHVIFILLERI